MDYKEGIESLENEQKFRVKILAALNPGEDDDQLNKSKEDNQHEVQKSSSKLFSRSLSERNEGILEIAEFDKKVFIEIDDKALVRLVDMSNGVFYNKKDPFEKIEEEKIKEGDDDEEEDGTSKPNPFSIFSKPIEELKTDEAEEEESLTEEEVTKNALCLIAQLFKDIDIAKRLMALNVVNDMLDRFDKEITIVTLTNLAKHGKTYRNTVLGTGGFYNIQPLIESTDSSISFKVFCNFCNAMLMYDFKQEINKDEFDDAYRTQSITIFHMLWNCWNDVDFDDKVALLKIWRAIFLNQMDFDDIAFINDASALIMSCPNEENEGYAKCCCRYFVLLLDREDLNKAGKFLLDLGILEFMEAMINSDKEDVSVAGATLYEQIAIHFMDHLLQNDLISHMCEITYSAMFKARAIVAKAFSLVVLNCPNVSKLAENADVFKVISSPGIDAEDASFRVVVLALIKLAEVSCTINKMNIKEFIDTDDEYKTWIREVYDYTWAEG